MVYLEKYSDFLFESFFKKDLSCLYFSKKFREYLEEISKEGVRIAKILLKYELSDDIKSEITFIDVTDKNDVISFTQISKALRIKNKDSENNDLSIEEWINKSYLDDTNNSIWSQYRSDIKIGRFLKKLIDINKDYFSNISKNSWDNEIEYFTNQYKAISKIKTDIEKNFEIVSGEDIRKWYLESNYSGKNGGQLSNSCMKKKVCQNFFDIYVENPKVCQLLILKDDDNPKKITGRALIWRAKDANNNGDITYMDRIYTNNDSDIRVFEFFGSKNGYVLYNNHGKMYVNLEDNVYSYYPYMDTFRYYNKSTHTLYSFYSSKVNNDSIELLSISGGSGSM